MAWPPPALPINRTNADPQQDTHPNDHNAISLAINDTVERLILVNEAVIVYGTLGVQPGQIIPANTLADLTFPTMSNPAWGGSPVFTVPAGQTGTYSVTLHVVGPSMGADQFCDVIIDWNGFMYEAYIPPGKTTVVNSMVIGVAAGAVFKCSVFNPLPNNTFNARIAIYRVAGA